DGREIAFPGPVVQTRPGVPPENQIPVRNLVIDPRGPIGGRIVGPDLKLLVVLAVKVHKISGIRQREELVLNLLRDGVNALRRYFVVRERQVGSRVDDRRREVRKVPPSPGGRRNGGCQVLRNGTAARGFVREEEKGLVASVVNLRNIDGPSDGSAGLMVDPGTARRSEGIPRPEPGRAVVVEHAAVKIVCSGLRDDG